MKELRQEKTWHLPEHSRAVWLVPIESGWSRVRHHLPPALQGFAVCPQSYGNPLEDFKQRRDLVLLLFPCVTMLWQKEHREQGKEWLACRFKFSCSCPRKELKMSWDQGGSGKRDK